MARFQRLLALIAIALSAPSAAEAADAARIQSAVEAQAQDAAQYARANGVNLTQAMQRLRAQEDSVEATDRIQQAYRNRLAGISVEHRPDFRIVVLLTGAEPVPAQTISAGGMRVPILFRTGAVATRDQIVAAIRRHQAEIKAALPSQGMGLDPRTGELVVMVNAQVAARIGADSMKAKVEALTGVPVRIRLLDRTDVNSGIEGGARLEGVDPANGRRYSCTTGFVVTDGLRTGIVTAAHCPDNLTYYDPAGERIKLDFGGQWGWSYQDVQLHITERAQLPLFFADTGKSLMRPVTGWRARESSRAGDTICRRGETTGYSCSEIELVDYAPPGDLCGGPCDPVWVTVTGPSCKAGDSGGPIFSGTVAFGIMKGANYSRDRSCNFYYYMSVDYLPDGWSLLRAPNGDGGMIHLP